MRNKEFGGKIQRNLEKKKMSIWEKFKGIPLNKHCWRRWSEPFPGRCLQEQSYLIQVSRRR